MILLLGYGISNQSVEKYLIMNNLKYIIYDDLLFPNQIDIDKITLIIKSPVITNEHIIIKEFLKVNNIKNVITDLEYLAQVKKDGINNYIAVSGTNGKTTLVTLLKSLLPAYSLCGNIGYPIFDYVDCKDLLIECSSFMGENCYSFKPHIGVLLNIYKHHLDHHCTIINYIDSKINIFRNMNSHDVLIYKGYNHEYSKIIQKKIEILKCIKINIDDLCLPSFLSDYDNINIDCIKILFIIARIKNISICELINCLNNFKTLEHRMEMFHKISYDNRDILFYNNSKATNYLSTIFNLNNKNMKNKSVLLILGGKKKLDDNKEMFNELVKIIFCVGENALELYNYYSKYYKTFYFANLKDSVSHIKDYFPIIDVVLFSPSYQSFDSYKNYEERGRVYKKLIFDNYR